MPDVRFSAEWVDVALAAQRRHVYADTSTCRCGFQPVVVADWERHRMAVALAALADADALVTPPGQRAVDPDMWIAPCRYVSTACQHRLHHRCRSSCKFCAAPCACPDPDCVHNDDQGLRT